MSLLWIVNRFQFRPDITHQLIVEAPDAATALVVAGASDDRFKCDDNGDIRLAQFGVVASSEGPLVIKPILECAQRSV